MSGLIVNEVKVLELPYAETILIPTVLSLLVFEMCDF